MRKPALVVRLGLVALLASVGTVFGQPCTVEDRAEAYTRELLLHEASGTGDSWEDVLRRLVAEIDSVDFDSGDTTTTLKWNAHEWVTVRASLVNEPELFAPLAEAAQDDEALLDRLTDEATDGQDYEVAVDIHFQSEPGSKLAGIRTTADDAIDAVRTNMRFVASTAFGSSARGDCAAEERLFELLRPTLAQTVALRRSRAKELKASFSKRHRDDLVGRDEAAASLTYSLGIDDTPADARERVAVSECRETLFGEGGQSLPERNRMEIEALLEAAAASPEFDENIGSCIKKDHVAANGERAKNPVEAASDKPFADKRFSFQGEWRREDEYQFAHDLPSAITLPQDEKLVAKAAYSLKFTRDGKPVLAVPRYELSASWEEVDDESIRQSRLLARLIVSSNVTVRGQDTELTVGFVYANKPEFLAEQEFDEELSANVGLIFKFGSKQDDDDDD
jgi:hypothetical protein